MPENETNIGCFVCSGPIDLSAGRITLDIESGHGRHNSYLLCAHCGASIRRGIENAALHHGALRY